MGDRIASLFIEIGADGSVAVKNLNQVKGAMQDTGKASETMSQTVVANYQKMIAVGGGLALGIGTLKKVYDSTIKPLIAYGTQVKEISRLTGMNAEASSRYIQVADDMFISQESLTRSLEFAARKGIDPNIDSIARLADQYVKLQPGLERDQFLMEVFGKSGMDMAALLEGGAQGIISAWEKVPDSLIIDEETSESVLLYKQNMDQLNDTIEGIKIKIGSELLPVLNEAATTFNLLIGRNEEVKSTLAGHGEEVLATSESYSTYSAELIRAADAAGFSVDSFGNLVDAYGRLQSEGYMLNQSEYKVAKNMALVTDEAAKGSHNLEEFGESENEVGWAAAGAEPQVSALAEKITNKSAVFSIRINVFGDAIPDADYNYTTGGVVNPLYLRAGGGDYPGGAPVLVGERGPELMFPKAAGQVISNEDILRALTEARGNSKTNNYNLNVNSNISASEIVGEYAIFESRNR